MNVEVGGLLQRVLHPDVVALAVCLHAQTVYGGAFAAVEHPALQVGGVCGQPHQPAERIDLPHKMPLAVPPMTGCHGILPMKSSDSVNTRGPCPQPAAACARLDPRMPRTDDDDVVGSSLSIYVPSYPILCRMSSQTPAKLRPLHCWRSAAPGSRCLAGRRCAVHRINGLRFGVLCAVQLYYQFTR